MLKTGADTLIDPHNVSIVEVFEMSDGSLVEDPMHALYQDFRYLVEEECCPFPGSDEWLSFERIRPSFFINLQKLVGSMREIEHEQNSPSFQNERVANLFDQFSEYFGGVQTTETMVKSDNTVEPTYHMPKPKTSEVGVGEVLGLSVNESESESTSPDSPDERLVKTDRFKTLDVRLKAGTQIHSGSANIKYTNSYCLVDGRTIPTGWVGVCVKAGDDVSPSVYKLCKA